MDVVELSTGTKDGGCHRCERNLVRAGTVTSPGGKQGVARRWRGRRLFREVLVAELRVEIWSRWGYW